MICVDCLALVTSACETKRKCLDADKTLKNLYESRIAAAGDSAVEQQSSISIIVEVVETIDGENLENESICFEEVELSKKVQSQSLRRSLRQFTQTKTTSPDRTTVKKVPKDTSFKSEQTTIGKTIAETILDKTQSKARSKSTANNSKLLNSSKALKLFNCDLCSFATSRKKNLERHLLAVHLKTFKFICTSDDCEKEYTTKAGLRLHVIRDHDENSPFKCIKCDRKFSCASFLRHHNQGLSCRPRKKSTGKEQNEKTLACPHCPFKTAYQFSLKQHVNLIHFNIRKPWKCDHCENVEFTNRISLNNHLFTIHNMVHTRCSDCNQAFWSEAELKNHRESLKCNARIATEDDFLETDLGVKCNICERIYKTKKEWTTHYFNHHKFKKVCDICNMQLSTYGALKNHKKTVHEKIKAFACTECPKKFAAKHSLQFHLNMHSGMKKSTS